MKIFSLCLALLAVGLTGCYTQLATRGHYARSQAYPPYGATISPSSQAADSLVGSADDSLAGDSAYADDSADSLTPPAGTPTVIVNNYYDPYLSHRGYAHWEWDFPLISFGYYSSHYDRYSRPYWWNDPWYVGHYRSSHPYRYPRSHHRYHGSGPNRPGTTAPSGPYKSNKRLYNPEPSYPQLQKGQRGQRSIEPASAQVETNPAPKESTSEVRPQQQSHDNSEKADNRAQERSSERPQKGRRR